jgi:hypothetical protein
LSLPLPRYLFAGCYMYSGWFMLLFSWKFHAGQIYRVLCSYDSIKRNIWRDCYEEREREREREIMLAHHWDLVILSVTRFCFLLWHHLRRHLVYGPCKHESCMYWVSRWTDFCCYVTESGVFWAWETWSAKNCIHRDAFLTLWRLTTYINVVPHS